MHLCIYLFSFFFFKKILVFLICFVMKIIFKNFCIFVWLDTAQAKGEWEEVRNEGEVQCNSQQQALGQSELTATNAPVGRSIHWMGCVFSFDAGWGSSQSISFCCWPLYFFFFSFFCSWPFILDLTSHIATLLTFLPS